VDDGAVVGHLAAASGTVRVLVESPFERFRRLERHTDYSERERKKTGKWCDGVDVGSVGRTASQVPFHRRKRNLVKKNAEPTDEGGAGSLTGIESAMDGFWRVVLEGT